MIFVFAEVKFYFHIIQASSVEEKTDLSNSVNNLKDEEKKINICLETQENRVNKLGLIWIFFIKLILQSDC